MSHLAGITVAVWPKLAKVSGADLQELLGALVARTGQIVDALSACSEAELLAASSLPGWDRLTIACHLRYGARASTSMTLDTLADRPTSYYPDGRNRQRAQTLRPDLGEETTAVVQSLSRLSNELEEAWLPLTTKDWQRQIREPQDNPDLGSLPLKLLPLLRLTEVEVHGTDLNLGLPDWSDVFVHTALLFRISWLKTRRVNHRAFDTDVAGSWILASTDGQSYKVAVHGDTVETSAVDRQEGAEAVIEATSRDLLALLLGRSMHEEPRYRGNHDVARAFSRAFPGP